MLKSKSAIRGFTLVELLVVIAIIALLISILVPSLKSARDLAKEAFCKTNLNALNKSIGVYVELNRGYLMVFKQTQEPVAPDYPYQTFVCFKWDTVNPNNVNPVTGLYNDARGFGIVYSLKLLEPAELFYCPSQPDEKSTRAYYGYDHPWGGWIPDTDKGWDFVRMGYMYNPWVESNTRSGNYDYEDNLVYSSHPNDRFMTGDLMTTTDNMSHVQGNMVRWNLGYADGHVGTMVNKNSGTTTSRSICDFLTRLKKLRDAGSTTEALADHQWLWWGFNDDKNTWPMGRQLNPNGTLRYELLSKGG